MLADLGEAWLYQPTSRSHARNTIDCKRLHKWNYEQTARGVHESYQAGPVPARRVIRPRSAIRGFKDLGA